MNRRRRPYRVPVASSAKRIRVFAIGLVGVLTLCTFRAFQLQALDPTAYAAQAEAKLQNVVPLPATRGSIIDRNGVVLAQSQPAVRVIADPEMILRNGADLRYEMKPAQIEKAAKAPQAVADLLAKHLGGLPDDYLAKLTVKGSKYQIVAKQVPAWTYQQLQADLRAGEWYGIHSESDPIRTYPAGTLASNVVGFVDHEGKGAGGLEFVLDDKLTGTPGSQIFDSGKWGRIPLGTNVLTPAVDGASWTLTLDAELQWMAERALASGVQKAGADHGTAIVMNVKTGEVLAMANAPTFDSNNPGRAKNEDLGNRAVTDAYEPGSVEKILTMAILADTGLATPDTKVETPSQIRSGAGFIKDAWDHGTLYLTARGMVAKSSNIAAVKLGRTIDKATFSSYLTKFGLGATTGIGLPGEAKGAVPGPTMADYTRDQISFGSGLSVTTIQMASAIAAVANGGVYNQPTIIAKGVGADGKPIAVDKTESRRVVSPEASAMVMDAMEAVVTQGGGKALAIDGFRTAGKTGTATRFDPKCQCYNGYTASFAGVAPADDPQILVYVVVDNPRNGHFGSSIAGPVYQEIMQVALGRYAVLPSTTKPGTGAIEYQP